MNKLKTVFATLLCAGMAMPSFADILELKSGDLIKGSFAGGSQNSIRFYVNGELEVYPVKDVMSLTFNGTPAPVAQPAQAAPQAAAPQPQPQAAPAQPATPPQTAQGPVEVPAGTPFMIRTRSTLDSGKVGNGNRFTAVLEADLVQNGVVVAKQGDTVYGQVVDVKKAGRLMGTAHIKIALTGIKIDGQVQQIATNTLHLSTDSSTGTSAKRTLGAAAIGGLIDGSDGAKTGAAVGLGASILTSGNQVVVPAGTLLDFQFKVPLRLQS